MNDVDAKVAMGKIKDFVRVMDQYAKDKDLSIGEVFLALAILRSVGMEDCDGEGEAFWDRTVASLKESQKKAEEQ